MNLLKHELLTSAGMLNCMFSLICVATVSNISAANIMPPLRLVSFNARNVKTSVLLEWRTVGENNTDYFNIEQSTDGLNFTKVGSMKAAGIDPLNRYYSFTDARPVTGNNYYRLSMYDLDGTVNYSATQIIKAEAIQRLNVAPNPVPNSSQFYITWNAVSTSNAAVIIYDVNGKMVYKGKLDISGKTVIPVRNWEGGIYAITLDNGMRKEFSKLVVKK